MTTTSNYNDTDCVLDPDDELAKNHGLMRVSLDFWIIKVSKEWFVCSHLEDSDGWWSDVRGPSQIRRLSSSIASYGNKISDTEPRCTRKLNRMQAKLSSMVSKREGLLEAFYARLKVKLFVNGELISEMERCGGPYATFDDALDGSELLQLLDSAIPKDLWLTFPAITFSTEGMFPYEDPEPSP